MVPFLQWNGERMGYREDISFQHQWNKCIFVPVPVEHSFKVRTNVSDNLKPRYGPLSAWLKNGDEPLNISIHQSSNILIACWVGIRVYNTWDLDTALTINMR